MHGRKLLASSLETASIDASGWRDTGTTAGSNEGDYIDWLTIRGQTESVIADMRRIRSHPLVPGEIPIYGYVYDVGTGRLIEVPGATQEGRPRAIEAGVR